MDQTPDASGLPPLPTPTRPQAVDPALWQRLTSPLPTSSPMPPAVAPEPSPSPSPAASVTLDTPLADTSGAVTLDQPIGASPGFFGGMRQGFSDELHGANPVTLGDVMNAARTGGVGAIVRLFLPSGDASTVAGKTAGHLGAVAATLGGPKLVSTFLPSVPALQPQRAPMSDQAVADFTRVFKPGRTTYTLDQLRAAAPYLADEHQETPIADPKGTHEALENASAKLTAHAKAMGEMIPTDLIQTDPLAAAHTILDQSDAKPSLVDAARAEIDTRGLGQPLRVPEALDKIAQFNSEMNATSKAQNNWDVYNLIRTDPTYAAKYAAVQALRDGVDAQFAARGMPGFAQMRRDQSAIIAVDRAVAPMAIADETGQQTVPGSAGVARRALQVALPVAGGTIGTVAAHAMDVPPWAGTMIGGESGRELARAFAPRNLTRSDLIQRAFSGVLPSNVPLPTQAPQPQPTALLNAAPTQLGAAPDTSSVTAQTPQTAVMRMPNGRFARIYLGTSGLTTAPPTPALDVSTPTANIEPTADAPPIVVSPGAIHLRGDVNAALAAQVIRTWQRLTPEQRAALAPELERRGISIPKGGSQ